MVTIGFGGGAAGLAQAASTIVPVNTDSVKTVFHPLRLADDLSNFIDATRPFSHLFTPIVQNIAPYMNKDCTRMEP